MPHGSCSNEEQTSTRCRGTNTFRRLPSMRPRPRRGRTRTPATRWSSSRSSTGPIRTWSKAAAFAPSTRHGRTAIPGSSSSCSSTGLRPRASPFLPRVEQTLDVPALRVAELHVGQEAAHFRRIVVLDRSLEVLARRGRLLKLSPEPAQQADLSRPAHSAEKVTFSVSPASETEPPPARMTRTATAAPRSRSSSPSTTGPDDAVIGEIARAAPST